MLGAAGSKWPNLPPLQNLGKSCWSPLPPVTRTQPHSPSLCSRFGTTLPATSLALSARARAGLRDCDAGLAGWCPKHGAGRQGRVPVQRTSCTRERALDQPCLVQERHLRRLEGSGRLCTRTASRQLVCAAGPAVLGAAAQSRVFLGSPAEESQDPAARAALCPQPAALLPGLLHSSWAGRGDLSSHPLFLGRTQGLACTHTALEQLLPG